MILLSRAVRICQTARASERAGLKGPCFRPEIGDYVFLEYHSLEIIVEYL